MEIDIKKPAFDIKIRCNDEMLRQMQKHYGENLENLSTDNLINFLDKSTKTGQTSLRYFDVRDEQYLTQIHKFYNGNDWNGEISKFDVKEFINNTPILTPNEKQNEIDNMQDYKLRNKIMQLEKQANTLKENYENQIKELTKTFEKDFTEISKTIQKLKDIAWDRTSKRESSSMYKVLQGEKDYTEVQSNIGNVKVDKDFMEKEINKHLDDPAKRGMVTTEEMLSFPKVAKNVEPKIDERNKKQTWRVEANDGSVLRYGSKEFNNNKNLVTTYSETEYNERQDRGEQGQLRQEFNDRDFLRPADSKIIPKETKQSNTITQDEMDAIKKEVNLVGSKVLNSKENNKNIDRKLDL